MSIGDILFFMAIIAGCILLMAHWFTELQNSIDKRLDSMQESIRALHKKLKP